MIKKCTICENEFKTNYMKQICCSVECRKVHLYEWKKKYEKSPQRKKYLKSKHYIDLRKKYNSDPERMKISKIRNKKWYNDPINKEKKKEYQKSDKRQKYEYSIMRINQKKEYQKSDKYKEYRKRYLKKWNKYPSTKLINLKKRMKRRAYINNIIELYSAEEFMKKIKKYNNRCVFCNKLFNNKRRSDWFTIDHIYPISKASKDFQLTGIKRIYTIEDVQPLCFSCNSKKRNKITEELLK